MTNPYDTKPITLTDNIGLPGNPSFTDYRLYAADLRWNFKSLPDELAKLDAYAAQERFLEDHLPRWSDYVIKEKEWLKRATTISWAAAVNFDWSKEETKDMPDKPTIPSNPSDAADFIMEHLPPGVENVFRDNFVYYDVLEYIDDMLRQYRAAVYNKGYRDGRDDENESLRLDEMASDRGYID